MIICASAILCDGYEGECTNLAFAAGFEADVEAAAKKAGWFVNRDSNTHYCPECCARLKASPPDSPAGE